MHSPPPNSELATFGGTPGYIHDGCWYNMRLPQPNQISPRYHVQHSFSQWQSGFWLPYIEVQPGQSPVQLLLHLPLLLGLPLGTEPQVALPIAGLPHDQIVYTNSPGAYAQTIYPLYGSQAELQTYQLHYIREGGRHSPQPLFCQMYQQSLQMAANAASNNAGYATAPANYSQGNYVQPLVHYPVQQPTSIYTSGVNNTQSQIPSQSISVPYSQGNEYVISEYPAPVQTQPPTEGCYDQTQYPVAYATSSLSPEWSQQYPVYQVPPQCIPSYAAQPPQIIGPAVWYTPATTQQTTVQMQPMVQVPSQSVVYIQPCTTQPTYGTEPPESEQVETQSQFQAYSAQMAYAEEVQQQQQMGDYQKRTKTVRTVYEAHTSSSGRSQCHVQLSYSQHIEDPSQSASQTQMEVPTQESTHGWQTEDHGKAEELQTAAGQNVDRKKEREGAEYATQVPENQAIQIVNNDAPQNGKLLPGEQPPQYDARSSMADEAENVSDAVNDLNSSDPEAESMSEESEDDMENEEYKQDVPQHVFNIQVSPGLKIHALPATVNITFALDKVPGVLERSNATVITKLPATMVDSETQCDDLPYQPRSIENNGYNMNMPRVTPQVRNQNAVQQPEYIHNSQSSSYHQIRPERQLPKQLNPFCQRNLVRVQNEMDNSDIGDRPNAGLMGGEPMEKLPFPMRHNKKSTAQPHYVPKMERPPLLHLKPVPTYPELGVNQQKGFVPSNQHLRSPYPHALSDKDCYVKRPYDTVNLGPPAPVCKESNYNNETRFLPSHVNQYSMPQHSIERVPMVAHPEQVRSNYRPSPPKSYNQPRLQNSRQWVNTRQQAGRQGGRGGGGGSKFWQKSYNYNKQQQQLQHQSHLPQSRQQHPQQEQLSQQQSRQHQQAPSKQSKHYLSHDLQDLQKPEAHPHVPELNTLALPGNIAVEECYSPSTSSRVESVPDTPKFLEAEYGIVRSQENSKSADSTKHSIPSIVIVPSLDTNLHAHNLLPMQPVSETVVEMGPTAEVSVGSVEKSVQGQQLASFQIYPDDVSPLPSPIRTEVQQCLGVQELMTLEDNSQPVGLKELGAASALPKMSASMPEQATESLKGASLELPLQIIADGANRDAVTPQAKTTLEPAAVKLFDSSLVVGANISAPESPVVSVKHKQEQWPSLPINSIESVNGKQVMDTAEMTCPVKIIEPQKKLPVGKKAQHQTRKQIWRRPPQTQRRGKGVEQIEQQSQDTKREIIRIDNLQQRNTNDKPTLVVQQPQCPPCLDQYQLQNEVGQSEGASKAAKENVHSNQNANIETTSASKSIVNENIIDHSQLQPLNKLPAEQHQLITPFQQRQQNTTQKSSQKSKQVQSRNDSVQEKDYSLPQKLQYKKQGQPEEPIQEQVIEPDTGSQETLQLKCSEQSTDEKVVKKPCFGQQAPQPSSQQKKVNGHDKDKDKGKDKDKDKERDQEKNHQNQTATNAKRQILQKKVPEQIQDDKVAKEQGDIQSVLKLDSKPLSIGSSVQKTKSNRTVESCEDDTSKTKENKGGQQSRGAKSKRGRKLDNLFLSSQSHHVEEVQPFGNAQGPRTNPQKAMTKFSLKLQSKLKKDLFKKEGNLEPISEGAELHKSDEKLELVEKKSELPIENAKSNAPKEKLIQYSGSKWNVGEDSTKLANANKTNPVESKSKQKKIKKENKSVLDPKNAPTWESMTKKLISMPVISSVGDTRKSSQPPSASAFECIHDDQVRTEFYEVASSLRNLIMSHSGRTEDEVVARSKKRKASN